MKTRYILLLLVLYSLVTCSVAAAQRNKRSKPVPLAPLPDNPCELISPAQLSAISGLKVTAVKRVPSLVKIENSVVLFVAERRLTLARPFKAGIKSSTGPVA